MPRLFILVVILLFCIVKPCSASGVDTLKSHKYSARLESSVGVGFSTYYSDKYIRFISRKGYTMNPKLSGYDVRFDLAPVFFTYSEFTLGPELAMGVNLESNSSHALKWDHEFLSYVGQEYGFYSYTNEIRGSRGGGPDWWFIDVYDTVEATWIHTNVGLHYVLRPTFRNFSIAFGLDFTGNFIRIKERKREQVEYWSSNIKLGITDHYKSEHINEVAIYRNYYFSNPPFIGFGYTFNMQKMKVCPELEYYPAIQRTQFVLDLGFKKLDYRNFQLKCLVWLK